MDKITKEFIINKAKNWTHDVCAWTFNPTGSLHFKSGGEEYSLGCYVGNFHYLHPNYWVRHAIRIGYWIFALQRFTDKALPKCAPKQDPKTWTVAGIYGDNHYVFGELESPTGADLIRFVLNNFQCLFPEKLLEMSSLSVEIQCPEETPLISFGGSFDMYIGGKPDDLIWSVTVLEEHKWYSHYELNSEGKLVKKII